MTLDEIRHQVSTARDIPKKTLQSATTQAESLLPEFGERIRAGWQAGRMRFDRDLDREDWISQLHQAARDPNNGTNFSHFSAEPISDVFAALRKIPFFGFGRFRHEDSPDPSDPADDIRLITDERQWLERFFISEIVPPDVMMLECLDGFLTALAIGPEDVPQEEWWPFIWSESGKEVPEFTDDVQERYVRQLIDRHFKSIQVRLNAGYRHVPWIDENSPIEDAEEWVDGFSVGADLRAESWQVIGKHKDAGLAMAAIAMLTSSEQIMAREGWSTPLGETERCAIVARLPHFIRTIYAYWRGLPVQPLFRPRRPQKIGRNEPCPCGSGRKYKKCCGANAPG